MSALYGIGDLLSPTNLIEAYQRLASIHTTNPLFDFYNAKAATQADGDTFEFVVFDDTRNAAPINFRGSPARTLDTQGADKKTVSPIHVFNEITIPSASVEFLREANSPSIQDRGMAELRRQMELFAKRHAVTRAVTLAHTFRGAVYFDSNGLPLESSSGAATTVDLGVGATHKTQLAHASNGGSDIIATAWDNPIASILTDLRQIRDAAEYDRCPIPKHVWMNTVAIPWIVNNDEIADFVRLGSNPAEVGKQLEMYAGMTNMLVIGDWTFHFTNASYVGADGSTVRPVVPLTTAIITPDVNDGDWFLHLESSETIPTDDGVIGSLDEYFSKTRKVFGDFAYARIADNPLKVTMRMGMNFGYFFKEPNAVYYPTVDF